MALDELKASIIDAGGAVVQSPPKELRPSCSQVCTEKHTSISVPIKYTCLVKRYTY